MQYKFLNSTQNGRRSGGSSKHFGRQLWSDSILIKY